MISVLCLFSILSASALDLEKLLKTIKESSTGLSHKYNRTFLNISGLGIESLGSGLLESFGELTHLDVSFNDIRHVDKLAFYGLRKLRFLDLSHNSGLYTISPVTLIPMERLEEISLDATHISSLPANVFKHNKYLRKVSIDTPFLICDCDLQKMAQRYDIDGEARCLYPIKLRGSPVRLMKDAESVCKASADLKMSVIKSRKERSTGGSYWSVDCSVNNIPGHVIEIKLDGRPLHSLDGHFTVSERQHHDRHHIVLQVIENFVPHHPWVCYAEVDGAPDAKAFYIPASCPEEIVRNGSREVYFSRTPPDTILEVRCPNSSVLLSRECLASGGWSPADISVCPETAGNHCDAAVSGDTIDAYLRTSTKCPRGLILSKVEALQGERIASDLLTLCSLTSVEARVGLGRDRRGKWRCSLDDAQSSLIIDQRSPSPDRINRYRLLRLDISSIPSLLPNALSSELFGVGLSDSAGVTIRLHFLLHDSLGRPALFRLSKDGQWRKISHSYCRIAARFGATLEVSCSAMVASDFALFGVARVCDVTESDLIYATMTVRILTVLSVIIYAISILEAITSRESTSSTFVRNMSPAVFLCAALLRTFCTATISTATSNQLVHAGLIFHLLCWAIGPSRSLLLSISSCCLVLFVALSVPPIADHFADGRIYVTPASRFADALFTGSSDSLLLLSPLLVLTLLCLVRHFGSRIFLILSPFLWLLIILLRISETCDSTQSLLLNALLIVIPTAHTVLSVRISHSSRREAIKSAGFHLHISFTEEETSLY